MSGPGTLQAVFFDLDGTLLDSEPLTDALIQGLLAEFNLPTADLALSQFHGVTWSGIAAALKRYYPALAGVPITDRLQRDFHESLRNHMPPLIQGVQRAFDRASRVCPTGVVSSSQRRTIEAVIVQAGLAGSCSVLVGAEDVNRSKPDPECYLLAAGKAGAEPEYCLVFEDSAAGLQAARAAGMCTVGIVGNRDKESAAHLFDAADSVIEHYDRLPADFFVDFRAGR